MRTKIDYGIDLGTTNSAIARMENGVPVIKKSDTLKDTVPSCVNFNKRKDVLVGDSAFNVMKTDSARALKTFEKGKTNTFIEFKRTMGTTTVYESSNIGKNFVSSELSAEVLKKLKSLIQDEKVSSIIITVPAKFNNQQKEDTMKAAKLAGFRQVQLLQEPVAAATAYGLGSQSKDGFWLVFDFGGGTFDAALVKAEEGVLSVKDTEGDNWLGGKNLDEAIVDQIIISYLQDNYAINRILNNPDKKQMLRSAVKYYAEDAKNQLSFKETYSILSNLGDLPFEDENGEEPEIDLSITTADLEQVLSPIFQKAIDITKDLLHRNNLKGADLEKLILVGGPTHSPILRRMLREQITENVDTSVDPMTVVAKGAALYASTVDVDDEIQDETRDETKLQLEIKYEATSVETTEFVNIKVMKDKSIGIFPDEIFAEIVRSDEAWSSAKTKISDKKSALIEVALIEGRSNTFNVNVYDGRGNQVDCEPNQINILQGISGLDGMQVLPGHICIVKYFNDEEKDLILPVKGLEKNNRYPATGVTNGLKTRHAIRPGITKDIIRIPVYEGEYNAQKTNPDLNNLIYEVIITGESLPALLPEGSDVDITIKVDKSGLMKFSAYFPLLDYTEELEIPIKAIDAPEANELSKKINSAKYTALNVNATDIYNRLSALEQQLENEKGSADGRMKILDSLRKELLQLEPLEKQQEWPQIEKDLKDACSELEELVNKIKVNGHTGNMSTEKIDAFMHEFKHKIDAVIRDKNRSEAKELISEIATMDFELRNAVTGNAMDVQFLYHFNNEFSSYHWKDATKARQLINRGLQMAVSGNNNNIRPILVEIASLIPRNELPTDTLG
ncbi:MAG: Hsp70 family protein [Dysgonamonadaceae bacterium]|jgi:molecular chaperone DnaK|nr:Hsp70 family protein [Dysgonamonadaceae bacterium]